MDITQLQKINDYCWQLPNPTSIQRSAVKLFGSANIINALDEKVIQQIVNVAQLPGIVNAAMTMPDAHWGYGFPIGGVAAFAPENGGIISAGGVGFDISCGIRCLRTNLFLTDILPHAEKLAKNLLQTIPAGVGSKGHLKLSITELDKVLQNGAQWAVAKGYGEQADLLFVEEQGRIANAKPENVSELAKKRQLNEMGTLGSGNHYLEIQVVEKIYDQAAAAAFGIQEQQIIISIHCGSRGLGHQIGTDYLLTLAKAAQRLGIKLPERELACAPILSPEGQQYLGAMRAGINCALANRQILTHLTRSVFQRILPNSHIETLYDVSHNTCKEETHLINKKKQTIFVHRKGATRAFPPQHPDLPERYREVGQPVIIGGSMGTGSYVLAGNVENSALMSASHGAGRTLSRHQALKKWRGRELINELNAQGILIMSNSLRGIAEEAPGAYKDVDEVALATEKAGLARRVALLRPKICVKG